MRDRLRHIDKDRVAGLADSIAKIGLVHPISVRMEKGIDPEDLDAKCPVHIAGQHRLAACEKLGILVECAIFEGDEVDARLWEIAENLHRAELTVQERSEHIAEWVRLTEEKLSQQPAQLAPAVKKHGHAQIGSGINAATRGLGIDRTEAQRAVKIASLTPEAKLAAIETGRDNNQSALLINSPQR